MSVWAELKKVVNDNFNYPLNKQHFYPTNFGIAAEYFEASTTYTAPQAGVYIVTCVGRGGNASPDDAYGKDYCGESSNYYVASGGGGAVCKGYVILQAGQTVPITIDASKSSFGNLISAGAGQVGAHQYNTRPSVPAGGAVLIPGNIVNHAGYPGAVVEARFADAVGGNAGLITPWALNDNWSKGYVPFQNTEIVGGLGELETDAPAGGGFGKFGGGHGGTSWYNRGGVRGAGGYGAGGNWNEFNRSSGASDRYMGGSYSEGGKGIIIIEHGTIIYG